MPRKTPSQAATEAPDAPTPTVDFERSLAALEGIVEQLEGGELPLEKALAAFEEGVRLTRECQRALNAAEQKVAILAAGSPDDEPVAFTDAG